jgi:hypothetical protein
MDLWSLHAVTLITKQICMLSRIDSILGRKLMLRPNEWKLRGIEHVYQVVVIVSRKFLVHIIGYFYNFYRTSILFQNKFQSDITWQCVLAMT